MHPYYRANAQKLKKQMKDYLKFIRTDIEAIFGKSFDAALEEIWGVYERDMLERFPYIGGDSVGGTKNLTGAYFFVAFGEATKKYGLELERWGYLITKSFERNAMSIPAFMKKLVSFAVSRQKLLNFIVKSMDRKNRKNAAINPGSFETEWVEPNEDYSVIFLTHRCPLTDFANKYGYRDYLPYLCNLDYAMFGSVGLSLERGKTCAVGDDYCDFKVRKNAPIPAFWPPHILDESDPLK